MQTIRIDISDINKAIAKLKELDKSVNKPRNVSITTSLSKINSQITSQGTAAVAAGAAVGSLSMRLEKASQSAKKFGDSIASGMGSIKRFIPSLSALLSIGLVSKGLLDAEAAFVKFDSQIKEVTHSLTEYNSVKEQLLKLAAETGSNTSVLVNSLLRIESATRKLNMTNDERINLIEKYIKISKIGGANDEDIRRSMIQFTQAISGGILRMEEFNSMIEGTPALVRELGNQFIEVANGSLTMREAVLKGLITTDKLILAFENLSIKGKVPITTLDKLRASLNRLSITVGKYITPMIKSLGESLATLGNGIVSGFDMAIKGMVPLFERTFKSFDKMIGNTSDKLKDLKKATSSDVVNALHDRISKGYNKDGSRKGSNGNTKSFDGGFGYEKYDKPKAIEEHSNTPTISLLDNTKTKELSALKAINKERERTLNFIKQHNALQSDTITSYQNAFDLLTKQGASMEDLLNLAEGLNSEFDSITSLNKGKDLFGALNIDDKIVENYSMIFDYLTESGASMDDMLKVSKKLNAQFDKIAGHNLSIKEESDKQVDLWRKEEEHLRRKYEILADILNTSKEGSIEYQKAFNALSNASNASSSTTTFTAGGVISSSANLIQNATQGNIGGSISSLTSLLSPLSSSIPMWGGIATATVGAVSVLKNIFKKEDASEKWLKKQVELLNTQIDIEKSKQRIGDSLGIDTTQQSINIANLEAQKLIDEKFKKFFKAYKTSIQSAGDNLFTVEAFKEAMGGSILNALEYIKPSMSDYQYDWNFDDVYKINLDSANLFNDVMSQLKTMTDSLVSLGDKTGGNSLDTIIKESEDRLQKLLGSTSNEAINAEVEKRLQKIQEMSISKEDFNVLSKALNSKPTMGDMKIIENLKEQYNLNDDQIEYLKETNQFIKDGNIIAEKNLNANQVTASASVSTFVNGAPTPAGYNTTGSGGSTGFASYFDKLSFYNDKLLNNFNKLSLGVSRSISSDAGTLEELYNKSLNYINTFSTTNDTSEALKETFNELQNTTFDRRSEDYEYLNARKNLLAQELINKSNDKSINDEIKQMKEYLRIISEEGRLSSEMYIESNRLLTSINNNLGGI